MGLIVTPSYCSTTDHFRHVLLSVNENLVGLIFVWGVCGARVHLGGASPSPLHVTNGFYTFPS